MAEQNIYTVGGTIGTGPALYIPRRADQELLDLCRSGTFAYVLSSRQIGKSSLMVRTAQRLAEEGIVYVIIDLSQLGVKDITAEQWYLGLLTEIIEDLGLEIDLLRWWQTQTHLSPTYRFALFFQKVLLAEVIEPIVIFIDEIDSTLSLDFTDDFYAIIRRFYNARATTPEFQRLSFVLIGTATPGELMRDSRRTPFNIGQRVELTDFTFEEARPLANGLGLPPDQALRVLAWVLKWTGGHPYLTQRVCREIADQHRHVWSESEIDDLVNTIFFGERPDSNLQFVSKMLTDPARVPDLPGVLDTYRAIRQNLFDVSDDEQSPAISHLKLSGIVRREGHNLQVRNRIYEQAFDVKWIEEAELSAKFADPLELVRLRAVIKAKEEQAEAERQRVEAERRRAEIQTRRAREQARTAAQLRSRALMLTLALIMTILAMVAVVWFSIRVSAAEQSAAEKAATANSAGATALAGVATSYSARATAVAGVATANSARADANVGATAEALARTTAVAGIATAESAGATAEAGVATAERAKEEAAAGASTAEAEATRAINAEATALAGATQEALAKETAEASQGTAEVQATEASTAKETAEASQGTAEFQATEASTAREAAEAGRNAAVTAQAAEAEARTTADTARATAEANATVVAANRLAVQALNLRNFRYDLALLLSLEAKRMAQTMETQTSPLGLLETNPRLSTFLRGHKFAIEKVTISPDGKLLASGDAGGRIILWDITDRNAPKPIDLPLNGHNENRITSLAFNSDSTSLASGDDKGTIILWPNINDRDNFEKLILTDTLVSGSVTGLSFNKKDGRFPEEILASSDSYGIKLWNAKTGKYFRRSNLFVGKASGVTDIAFHPGIGSILVSGHNDGQIKVWDLRNLKEVTSAEFPGHTLGITSLAFGRLGQDFKLATGDGNGVIKIWDWNEVIAPKTTTPITISGHNEAVLSLTFSADGQYLASAGRDVTVKLWDVTTGWQKDQALTGQNGYVQSLVFDPRDDSNLLVMGTFASNDEPGDLILWDVNARQRLGTPLSPGSTTPYLTSLAFSSKGSLAVGNVTSSQVTRWNVEVTQAGTPRLDKASQTLSPFGSQTRVAFNNPDGTILAVSNCGSLSKDLCTWGVSLFELAEDNREPIGTFETGESVNSISFSPNGQILAYDDTPLSYPGEGCSQDCVSLLNIDQLDRLPRVDKRKAIIAQAVTSSTATIYSLAFSADEQHFLAAGGVDNKGQGIITLWDVKDISNPQFITEFVAHKNSPVTSLAFNPRPKNKFILASASNKDTRIKLWDLSDTSQPVPITLIGHTDWVTGLAFRPDGTILASSSWDRTVKLWDMAERRLLLGLPVAGPQLLSLTFSPDNKWLAIGSGPVVGKIDDPGKVILWNFDPKAWEARACAVANRNLTQAEWNQYIGETPETSYCQICPGLPAGPGDDANAPVCPPRPTNPPELVSSTN